MGNPELTDYSGTKGAIASWTKALGLQLGPRGIRVNGIAPGIIYTVLQSASTDKENMDSLGKGDPPLPRPAQPSEVGPMCAAGIRRARVAAHLCQTSSSQGQKVSRRVLSEAC